jgi:hypothetical protein
MLRQKTAKNSNEMSAKTFRGYLSEKKMDTNFETFTIERLSEILAETLIRLIKCRVLNDVKLPGMRWAF